MNTVNQANPTKNAVLVSALIRGLGAFALAGVVIAQMFWVLEQAQTSWGSSLNPQTVTVTAIVLAISAVVTGLVALFGALSIHRGAAKGDIYFMKMSSIGFIRAILGEPPLAVLMLLVGWLCAGSLLDMSSGRINGVVMAAMPILWGLVLFVFSYRPFTIISPSQSKISECKYGSPLIARKTSGNRVQGLEFGLDNEFRAYIEGRQWPIILGQLSTGVPMETRKQYAYQVAQSLQLPIRGLE